MGIIRLGLFGEKSAAVQHSRRTVDVRYSNQSTVNRVRTLVTVRRHGILNPLSVRVLNSRSINNKFAKWAFTRSDRRTDRSVRLVCPTGRSDDRIV